MVKRLLTSALLLTLMLSLTAPMALAAEGDAPVTDATFKSRCQQIDTKKYPECADSPSECGSHSTTGNTPVNCIFIEEPIGGRPGYDLYKIDCLPKASPDSGTSSTEGEGSGGEAQNRGQQKVVCTYTLWYGEAIVGSTRGPVQAILAFEEDKDFQGPFGLLYNYLGLVYNYMSGIIIGFVILIVIIGGVRIITAAGDTAKYEEGKKWIIKALVGMILWFTASVILYTINPTFFAF